MYNRIDIFDFDETIIHHLPVSIAKNIYFKKYNMSWPYTNWWEVPASLDPSLGMSVNLDTLYLAHQSQDNKNVMTVIMTGRVSKLKNQVRNILTILDLNPNILLLSPDGFTFPFKMNVLKYFIKKYPGIPIRMYEDKIRFAEKYVNILKYNNVLDNVFLVSPTKTKTMPCHIFDDPPPTTAGFVPRINNNLFTLIKNNDMLDLPKGNIEKYESVRSAALREFVEETNLTPHLPNYKAKFRIGNTILFPCMIKGSPRIHRNTKSLKLEHKGYITINPIIAESLMIPYLRSAAVAFYKGII